MNHLYLSYLLNENTPIYGGEKAIYIENRSEMSKGDSSNTKYLKFPNHSGTHIDFPNHFSDSGKKSESYEASFWFTSKITVVKYLAKDEEIINQNCFDIQKISANTEFLIINTEFYKRRKEKAYWNNNPGLSPELASNLKKQCPNLRFIGFDFISLTSYQNRILGRKAHVEFLIKNEILLIEDMDLSNIDGINIKSVTALPLLMEGLDGAPISIIANYE